MKRHKNTKAISTGIMRDALKAQGDGQVLMMRGTRSFRKKTSYHRASFRANDKKLFEAYL